MNDAAWLVQFIREQVVAMQQPMIHLAKVSATAPLRIKLGNVELGSPFLMAPPDLLAATKSYQATMTTETGNISGTLTATQTEPEPLANGDTVLVFSVGERFIVMGKVVDM
ncbi:DUF2577 family protein [Gorillibacterium sp. sgz5001074]|uniref:DUF2577 family protein n=1 Tax=Gorillibacterium sp. sgz5001074 TaxID=3446695 RepID=UPI003F6668FB